MPKTAGRGAVHARPAVVPDRGLVIQALRAEKRRRPHDFGNPPTAGRLYTEMFSSDPRGRLADGDASCPSADAVRRRTGGSGSALTGTAGAAVNPAENAASEVLLIMPPSLTGHGLQTMTNRFMPDRHESKSPFMLVNDQAPAAADGPITLAIDIGGSHLKAGRVAAAGTLVGDPVRIATPSPATPAVLLPTLVAAVAALGHVDRIAAGFPGVVRGGVVLTAPNLGTAAWHGFPLADQLAAALHAPARVLNDASVQGLGVIAGRGLECVITLGTGMGFALFQDGRLAPHLELSRHPFRKDRIYDDYIGNAQLVKIGAKRWNKRMGRVIPVLRTLINFDTLLIGGGNARCLKLDLPPDVRVVPNQAGITGGIRLWDPAMNESFTETPPATTQPIAPA